MGLLRRVGLYGIATVLPSAITFFFLPVLTRQMSSGDFGTLSALTALYSLFFLAFTLYLDRALGRLYFLHEGEARKELIGSLFLTVVIIATAGMALTVGLSPFLEHIYPQISARRFYSYAFSVYFTVIIYFLRTYLTAAEKPAQYLWLSVAASTATVLAMYWYVVVKKGGVDGWITAQVLAGAIVAGPAALAVIRVSTLRLRWNLVREGLVYAGPMIPAFFLTWLAGSADRLFVARLAGMTTNALYGAATQLSNILALLFLPFFMAYMPLFYRLSSASQKERDFARRCNRLVLILIGTAGCSLIID